MRDIPPRSLHPFRFISIATLAFAMTLSLASNGVADDTLEAMNKVLQNQGLTQNEAATLRNTINSGAAQERLPSAHHGYFVQQLKKYGLNDEARRFSEIIGQEQPSATPATQATQASGGSGTPDAVNVAPMDKLLQNQALTQNDKAALLEIINTGAAQKRLPSTQYGYFVDQLRKYGLDGEARRFSEITGNESSSGSTAENVQAELSLGAVVNRVMRGESLTSKQQDLLLDGLADNSLNRMIPADRHDDFTRQLSRYGMEEEAAIFHTGISSQKDLLEQLPGTPRPMFRRDFMEEYIEGVQYFSNELDQNLERRTGAQLIVVDYDNRIMRIDDPLAGGTLERVGSSCLLNSGREPREKTPPQTYGTDMLVFEQPVKGRVRIQELIESEYVTTYLDYSVQRYAVSWSEQKGENLPAYFYGGQIHQRYNAEGEKIGTRIAPSTWHRYSCNVRSVNF